MNYVSASKISLYNFFFLNFLLDLNIFVKDGNQQ